ncbi:MAG: HD-GYP domain-containing protein [Candidatus Aminicenantia bacterium]
MEEKTKKEDFLFSFSSCVTSLNLYGPEHSITIKSIENSFYLLKEILSKNSPFRISAIDERLFIDDEPLWKRGIAITNIAEKFKIKKVNSLSFHLGVDLKEFKQFINEFAIPVKKGGLEVHSTPHIKIGQLSVFAKEEVQTKKKIFDFEKSGISFEDEIEELKEIFKEVKSLNTGASGSLKEMVLRFVKFLRESVSPLLLLVPFRGYEEYIYSHSINVCILSLAQSESLGFEDEALMNMGISALLHDIGKLFVPREILLKKSYLSVEEWEAIKKHPEEGAKLLMKIPTIPPISVIISYEHHIKFDGSGYPRKKYNGKPTLLSQIVSIADFYDALRTERTYRASLEHDEILALMDIKSGTDFNPKLLSNFMLLF